MVSLYSSGSCRAFGVLNLYPIDDKKEGRLLMEGFLFILLTLIIIQNYILLGLGGNQ